MDNFDYDAIRLAKALNRQCARLLSILDKIDNTTPLTYIHKVRVAELYAALAYLQADRGWAAIPTPKVGS